MRYQYNGHFIKTIPDKFSCIENIGDFMEDLEHKRLTGVERRNLQRELLRLHLAPFIKEKESDYLINQYITGAHPLIVLKIITPDSKYWAVKFSNGLELKCSHRIFAAAPIKKTLNRLY